MARDSFNPMDQPPKQQVFPATQEHPGGLPSAMMALLALGVVVSLVWLHGFTTTPRLRSWLNALDVLWATGYVVNLFLPWIRRRAGREYIRLRRFELLLLILLLAAFSLPLLLPAPVYEQMLLILGLTGTRHLYFDLLQLFVLANFILQLARWQQRLLVKGVRPEWILSGSFAGLIILGTLLLLLPRAASSADRPITVMDAFFTATSATCVTGLVIRDTGGDFSTFGQMIIMTIFQMGGLGIMTFVAFVTVFSRRSLPIPQMVAFKQMMSATTLAHLKKQIFGVVAATVLIELLGGVLLYTGLPDDTDPLLRLKWSVFHAISAFCNAGFSLQTNSLVPLQTDWAVNVTIMMLIVLGGLGFLVIPDLVGFKILRLPGLRKLAWVRRQPLVKLPGRLSVQTKLSLVVTVVLLILGFAGFLVLEQAHALRGQSAGDSCLIAAFQSVTARTAGFHTVDMAQLRTPTLLLIMLLMVVGACPVSTGGGIKTVTLGVLFLAMRSMIQGSERVEAFGRTLPAKALFAALSVFLLYVATATLGLFLLACFDPHLNLRDLAFEMISALSTVGLSTGITAQLSPASQLVLCAAMFIGRIGPISLVLSVFQAGSNLDYEYPQEEVVVG